jgi:hypothetical protein
MTTDLTWYPGSSDPNAADTFQQIQQWWRSIQGKEIIWQQRMVQGTEDWRQLDWSSQRFDERFFITSPEIRGITLYWHKASQPDQEQSTTPQRLELDLLRQELYIFPKSQQGLVLRVQVAEPVYQTIALTNPAIAHQVNQGNYILSLTDETQKLILEVTLSPETLLELKRQIP